MKNMQDLQITKQYKSLVIESTDKGNYILRVNTLEDSNDIVLDNQDLILIKEHIDKLLEL